LLLQTDGLLTRELRSEFKISLENHAKYKQLGRLSKLEDSIALHPNEDVGSIQLAQDRGGSCECDNECRDSMKSWGCVWDSMKSWGCVWDSMKSWGCVGGLHEKLGMCLGLHEKLGMCFGFHEKLGMCLGCREKL
jgi:hypothetical protein